MTGASEFLKTFLEEASSCSYLLSSLQYRHGCQDECIGFRESLACRNTLGLCVLSHSHRELNPLRHSLEEVYVKKWKTLKSRQPWLLELLVWAYSIGHPLCNLDWPGTCYTDKDGLKHIEISLSLLP